MSLYGLFLTCFMAAHEVYAGPVCSKVCDAKPEKRENEIHISENEPYKVDENKDLHSFPISFDEDVDFLTALHNTNSRGFRSKQSDENFEVEGKKNDFEDFLATPIQAPWPTESYDLKKSANLVDNRVPIAKNEWPYTMQGVLLNDGTWGTGTLCCITDINGYKKHVLITAAHNVCFRNEQKQTIKIPKSLDFYVNTHGRAKAGQKFKVSCVLIPPDYMKFGSNKENKGFRKEDYALCVLEERIPWAGYVGLYTPDPSWLKEQEISVSGYPGDKAKPKEYYPYCAKGKPYDVKGDQIFYKLATNPGVSGGPIIVHKGDEALIVGVHGISTPSSNIGTLLTPERWAMLKVFFLGREYNNPDIRNITDYSTTALISLYKDENNNIFIDPAGSTTTLRTDNGVHRLVKRTFPNLKEVSLNIKNPRYVFALSLNECPLTVLDMDGLGKTNKMEQIQALTHAPWGKTLKWLRLSGFCDKNEDSTPYMQVLAKAPWVNLEKINLEKNGLTNESLFPLVQANWFNLEELNLDHNHFGLKGFKLLAKYANTTCKNLKIITYYNNCAFFNSKRTEIIESLFSKEKDAEILEFMKNQGWKHNHREKITIIQNSQGLFTKLAEECKRVHIAKYGPYWFDYVFTRP